MKNKTIKLIIIWQLALSCLFLCGWTYTLKTNTPAGTDDPTEADDRMRETKAVFVERLDKNHYFYPSATSTYDATDAGKHRYITFREPNDLTSMTADESALFSKDASSVTELHWIDESDNVLQLTSGGTINIVSADLLGTLANNTYFTAVDNAGTSTVDLIKADANDVAVVPNDSQTATNAAPTQTKALTNKKYVDDRRAYIKLSDTKAQNTAGGTLTAGSWQKRALGTEDSDTGSHCSLASDQITLDVGTYECLISCPAYGVAAHQARLYNTTGSAVVLTGTSAYARATTNEQETRSFIVGRFTIAASQALEVQHYCATTKATTGLGNPCNFTSEVYTIAEFWKI